MATKTLMVAAGLSVLVAAGCTIEPTEETSVSEADDAIDRILDDAPTRDSGSWPAFARDAFLDGCGEAANQSDCLCLLDATEEQYPNYLDLPAPASAEYQDAIDEAISACL